MIESRRKSSLVAVVVALLAVLLWGGSSAWGSGWKLDPSFADGGIRLESGPGDFAPIALPLRDGGLYTTSNVLVKRFREDGEFNTSFGREGWAWGERSYDHVSYLSPRGLALSSGGRPMLVGMAIQADYEEGNDEYYPYLGRFLPNGRLDRSFAYGGVYPRSFVLSPRYYPRFFNAMTVTGKGAVFVGGSRGEFGVKGERLAATILKFTPRGRLDRSFAVKGVYRLPARASGRRYQEFTDLEMVGRGRILAAGYSRGRTLLTRLLPSGRRDRSFGEGAGVVTRSYAPEPYYCPGCESGMKLEVTRKGRIYVLDFTYPKGKGMQARLFAYSPSGRPVRSFGRKGRLVFGPLTEGARPFFPSSFVLGSRGEITLVGDRARLGKRGETVESRLALLRLRPNGSRDRSFGKNGLLAGVIDAQYGRRVVEDFKGRLLVSGIRENVPYQGEYSDSIGYAPRGLIARLIPEP